MLRLMMFPAAARRAVVFVVAAVAIVVSVVTIVCLQTAPRFNVILITLDTTRADHIGLYGYQQGLTGALDEFGAQGVVFDHAYATAPLTLPSHTTILTGLYPPEHGLRLNGTGRLSSKTPVLPEMLKRRGYDTGAFLAAFVLDSKFGLDRGFDVYDDDLTGSESAGHSAERRRDGASVIDSALAWLRERINRPFFCWIHLYDAHHDYDPRPELFGDRFADHPYDAGIAVEAQQLGRVLSFLRENKLTERTFVIIAGDHGEGLGEHLEDEHGMFIYNSTLHVPWVMSGPPEYFKPGHRAAETVSLVDLLPTLLDVLNLPAPRHVSGRSLRTALLGNSLPPRPCYAETEAPFHANRWCPELAVISEGWKFIKTTKPELFDLSIDPREETNLVESAQEQRQRMESLLESMLDQFMPAESESLALSEKDLHLLRDLGYAAGGPAPAAAAQEVLADMKDMQPYYLKYATAQQQLHERKFSEAAATVQEIVAGTDAFPLASILLGDALRELGRLEAAAAAYKTAIEKCPNSAIAHAHYALIFVQRGELERTAEEFQEAVNLDSEASQAHLDLAEVLKRLRRFEEAEYEYREAIRSDPGFVVAHIQLGLLLAGSRRLKAAADCFEAALSFDPRSNMARINLVNACLELGQLERALKHAQADVDLSPASFEARFNLGIVLLAQHRRQEAVEQFQQAHDLRPDDPRPLEEIRRATAQVAPRER